MSNMTTLPVQANADIEDRLQRTFSAVQHKDRQDTDGSRAPCKQPAQCAA